MTSVGPALDVFLPPTERKGQSERSRRCRIGVGIILGTLFGSVVLAGVRLFHGYNDPLALPTVLVLLGLLVVSRATGDPRLIAHGICAAVTCGVTALTAMAGGSDSIALTMFAAVPLVGFFAGGVRVGVPWAFGVCSLVICFGLWDLFGIALPLEGQPDRTLPVTSTLLLTVGILTIAWAYERQWLAELRMRSSLEQELEALLVALPDGVVEIDRAGLTRRVFSRAACPEAVQTGLPFASIFQESRQVEAALARTADRHAHVLARPVGEKRAYDIRLVPMEESGGTLALIRDRADVAAVEERLSAAQFRVRMEQTERLLSLGILAGGIAHEINNPLAIVRSNLDAIRRWLRERGEGHHGPERFAIDAVADARLAVERVSRIVDQLDHHAQLARGHLEEAAVCSAEDAVDTAVDVAKHDLQHRAHLVVRHEPTPLLRGDPGDLTQVVVRLVRLIVRFLPPGGDRNQTVEVTTGPDSTGGASIRIRTSASLGGGHHLRGPHSIMSPVTGTSWDEEDGMVLSVCRGLLRKSGGELRVVDDVDAHTQLEIVLPAADERIDLASDTDVAVPNGERAGPPRVLVVDDEPHLRRAVRRILRNYDLEEAASGVEALQILATDASFDTILCDVMMADLSGVELYHRVRAVRPVLAERFIFITGGAFDPATARALASLPNVVVKKPFSAGSLSRHVAECVARQDE